MQSLFHHRTTILWLLVFALYGLFGSPTPDNFGWVEIILAALLISLTLIALPDLMQPHYFSSKPFQSFFLFYGLGIGLLLSSLNGHETHYIVRDLIAFSFLCLPILFTPLKKQQYFLDISLWGSVFVGLAYAFRFLVEVNPVIFLQGGNPFADPHFSYLANEPLVFFSYLFLIYKAADWYSAPKAKLFSALLCFLLSILPLLAMAMMQQRATLLLSALYWIILWFFILSRSPAKAIMAVIVISLMLLPLKGLLIYYADILATKSRIHGLNMRLAEWQTLANLLLNTPLAVIVGKGWGAGFISPAVGNVSVQFTHNLFSMYWLKLGFVGMALLGLYLSALFYKAQNILLKKPVYACTMLMPLFIGCFVYANFKSLGFGILLLMMILHKIQKNEPETAS